ncbi:MAG TPA: ATP-binding protein [Gemmatimonadaceae bacterium]|nr:ATP-binding protein [Gemmatimonadaceae bacterium]
MTAQSYNLTLLVLSTAVALVGAYATIEIARRVRFHEGRKRYRWACVGALTLALTVWSVDLIGTMALSAQLPIWFDTLSVISSFIAALVAGGAVFFAVYRTERSILRVVLAIIIAIAAIGGAQYATFMGTRASLAAADASEILLVGSFDLGVIVSVVSIVLLAAAAAATRFDRWSITTRTRFESLLELAPQIVWFAESDGRISYCNQYWYSYTGLSTGETLGDGWVNALHPDDRDPVLLAWANAVRAGEDFESEMRLRSADGEYCWFLVRSRPSRDESGKITSWLGIAVDIEERKHAEEEALAASKAKSEFLASMSHELRTPLNAIGGYAELLALGVRGSLNADQAQDIARIRRSQKHLLTLINDVLNFAKVDAGQAEYRMTAVPIDEALKDTESMIAPQILAKGLKYTYKGAGRTEAVLADPEKMQQIVLNLLSNAVKFTETGGSITMSATPRSDCIEIAVKDTGVGIPEEKADKVFDPFVQAGRQLNQPAQGIGLGLAISRDLARAMNGEITLDTTVGKGSTFTLTLPRAPRMDPADVAAATAAALGDGTPVRAESGGLADRALEEAAHP